jgi:RNA polymerase sigma factor (sigma-70 family)
MTPIVSTTLLRTQSDARLVELARDGHERAFEAIVERYRRPLTRYVRRMLPSARVEDVLQIAFINAWSSLSGGAEIRDLRPWMYRIAHNAAVNTLKRAGYDFDELRDSLKGADGPDVDVERQAVMRETLSSLAALPERQRRALLETAVEGREPHEVAVEMGMTDNAFRQLVFRARATMRAAATAVTPMPLALWAATLNAGAGGDVTATRIAEMAGGAGSAGIGATLAKTGAVVVAAGALVAGGTGVVVNGGDGRGHDQSAAYAAADRTTSTESGAQSEPEPGGDRGGATTLADDNRGRSGDSRGRGGNSGRGSSGSGSSRRKSSSGKGSSGSSGDDNSGKGSSGSGSSEKDGSSDDSSSGSGDDSSDSSSSGKGSSGSSGDDSSGSGSSGSGSSGSGGGDDGGGDSGRSSDDGVLPSVSVPAPVSGSSGSGSSGSGSSGSGSSGSGSGDDTPDD